MPRRLLERVRAAEFRFLEDCLALGREKAHLESWWEEITTSQMSFKSTRFDENGVPHEITRRTKTTNQVAQGEDQSHPL